MKNIFYVDIQGTAMDLSAAYGPAFFAPPLGMTDGGSSPTTATTVAQEDATELEQLDTVQQPVPGSKRVRRHNRSTDGNGTYAISVEIGRDEAHLLMIFIAVLILSLLFSAKK